MSRTFYAWLFAGLLLGACADEPPVIFSHSPQPSSEAGAGNISAAGGALSRTGAGGARPSGAGTAGKGGTSAITGTGGTSGATTGAAGNANGGLAGAAGTAAAGGSAAGAAGTSDGGTHDADAGIDGGSDAGCSHPLPEGVEPAPAKPPRCDDPPMMCPPGTKPYVSPCGCGCQQGGDCPREVHCGGPGPTDPLCTDLNRCPYTTRKR